MPLEKNPHMQVGSMQGTKSDLPICDVFVLVKRKDLMGL
jgi:hypothetical protein